MDMETLLSKLDEKLAQQTITITSAVTENVMKALDERMKTITAENKALKTKVEELEKKVNNFEKEKRRYNLVFFGIEEKVKTEGELVDYIKDIVIDTGIHLDSQEISNVHRIGRWDSEKNRPVVVTFTSSWKKRLIWQNKSSLPQGMYIKEDYTKDILQKRKELQPQLEEERRKGNRAFLVYDKLVVKAPIDKNREKRKREESGSPNSTSQKKINAQNDTMKALNKPTQKEATKTSILNFVERGRQATPPEYPKN
ncbi:hypothetical protein O0L34_g16603 [Tuta absoluta]|nr:hypothetical protein O0L34_g16579 [Tuta absoluta]KAJ2940008.1 hypothetical protein O0L34_g14039 [Tuta absoluta]KAJ2943496.1 hypothetical protein O0L34_g16603 [Tuta absoluta]